LGQYSRFLLTHHPHYQTGARLSKNHTDLGSCRQFFVTIPILGLHNYLGEGGAFCLDTSPPAAGSGSSEYPSMFWGVSALSTRDTEGPGHCESGVLMGEELDGVGDKRSDNTTMAHAWTL